MRLRRNTQAGLASVIAIMIWLAALFYGCSETPTRSGGEPKDYTVWFFQPGSNGKLHAYHPETKVLETTEIPWDTDGRITVSPDGDLIYLPNGPAILVLETDSLTVVNTIPYDVGGTPWGRVIVSPDNKYLAVLGYDSLWILNREDYSRVHAERSGVWNAQFSSDSKTLYAAYGDILKLSFTESGVESSIKKIPSNSAVQIIPTLDESKWLTYSWVGLDLWVFEVFDIAADSNVFLDIQAPGAGRMAMTPDGQFVYYGNPGTLLIGDVATHDFTEFHISNNEKTRIIPTRYFIDSITPNYMPIYDLVVTPDGKWLVAMDGPTQRSFLSYNLEKGEFSDYQVLENAFFRNCSVQSNR